MCLGINIYKVQEVLKEEKKRQEDQPSPLPLSLSIGTDSRPVLWLSGPLPLLTVDADHDKYVGKFCIMFKCHFSIKNTQNSPVMFKCQKLLKEQVDQMGYLIVN